jgi:hypothetical protein
MKTPRRFYLRKSQEFYRRQEEGLAAAYRGLQDLQPGTPLPATFPSFTELAAARYTTKEDLDGASLDELQTFVGLNRREAQVVLDALAALP